MSFNIKYFLIILLFSVSIYPQQDTIKNYFSNGKAESIIPMYNGVREGIALFYFEDGTIKEEIEYVAGKAEGLAKFYNEEGKLKEMLMVENGKREGPTSVYSDEGEYLNDISFANGKIYIDDGINYFETASTDEPKKQEPAPVRKKVNKNNIGELPPDIAEEKILEDDPAYYLTAEVMPVPVGGWETLHERLFYPQRAKEEKIQGEVVIKAFINKEGSVTKAEVKTGIDKRIDESARLTVFYTRFQPGVIRGRKVNIEMDIPLEFKLEKAK